jgi:predicted Zn-ribbon and HTH transcriptional regulator
LSGRLRSFEHENIILSSLGAHIAQIRWQTSTDGIEFMDAVKTLKAALEAIRDIASNALTQIDQSQEERSMRWVCKECRYVKRFTKPVSLETAGRCPRCKGTAFKPTL